jgi:general secretion pathway protein H
VSIDSPARERAKNSAERAFADPQRFFPSTAKRHTVRGFSLIELLVVVAIVGVLALAVTLSIGGSAQRQLLREAERFQALIGQACEQAELSGREIGVIVGAGGYSFRMLGGTEWRDFPEDAPLRTRPWIDGLRVDLSSEGRHVDLLATRDAAPQLVCFSSGELTPFALTLELGDAPRYRVSGADDATLKTERVGDLR